MKSCWSCSVSQCHLRIFVHTSSDAMASCSTLVLWVFSAAVCSPSLTLGAEDLCTNQWDISVEGVEHSELTVHHSSTFVPGLLTHLVWHWHQRGKPSATVWLSQAQKRGKFSGGFIAQPKSGFKMPSSFHWTLYNGSLSVSSHGQPQELTRYPAWRVTVCNGLVAWGVTEEKEVYVTYDAVNETRSLDESWTTTDMRIKRQAEFPVVPEEPQKPKNGTFAMWWRRFIDSIGGSYQGDKPRSWILDLTELILKLIVSTTARVGSSNIPRDSDAEEIPRTNRDVESVTKDGFPRFDVPRRVY